jgi:hypothetical protein
MHRKLVKAGPFHATHYLEQPLSSRKNNFFCPNAQLENEKESNFLFTLREQRWMKKGTREKVLPCPAIRPERLQ